jgi:hypothetical protein
MTTMETTFLPSPRLLAIAAIVFFVPVAASFALAPNAWWADYLGMLFHISLFLLVPWLPAPSWAKAAGYGWLIVDVMAGALSINAVPDTIAQPIRLGGHIFAGLWIVTASQFGSLPIRIVGTIAGVYLFSFTFISPMFPMSVLGPASMVVLIWLAIIAWQNGTVKKPVLPSASI